MTRRSRTRGNSWVELRGLEPLTSFMPSTTRYCEFRVVSEVKGRQRAHLSRWERTDW